MRAVFHPIVVGGLGLVITAGLHLVARGEAKVSLPAASALQSGPGTFWNWLGIPQGTQKLRDARLNRRGNHPEWERVPPPKRIADPENLKSPNPAIATAAKIKKDQDLAPQKIKAIKYLGEIACCCPTNKEAIKNALLAALDDCTDEVRLEAALAICRAAGNPCTICNQCSCCTADVMNKLDEMANGQDEQGCWIEPNAGVREAASMALEACRSVRRPELAVPSEAPLEEGPKERRAPTLAPVPVPAPQPKASPTEAPKAQSPKQSDSEKPAEQPAAGEATASDGGKVRQVRAEESVGFAVITDDGPKPAAKPQSGSVAPKAPDLLGQPVSKSLPDSASMNNVPAKVQIIFPGTD